MSALGDRPHLGLGTTPAARDPVGGAALDTARAATQRGPGPDPAPGFAPDAALNAAPDTAQVAVLAAEIRALAAAKDALILAHHYQRPEVQDVADYVGDSLGLARRAAASGAPVIVFCGVHFMAETAAILCPEATVILPDLEAGCSLAASVDAAAVRAWKAEHPDAVVVSYVNTSAEVKAEADYCCTSSNARAVIEAIPPPGDPLPARPLPRALARAGDRAAPPPLAGGVPRSRRDPPRGRRAGDGGRS